MVSTLQQHTIFPNPPRRPMTDQPTTTTPPTIVNVHLDNTN